MVPETSLQRAPERAYLPLRQGISHRRPGERRPRRKVACRPRVELARALRLGHRVVRRDPAVAEQRGGAGEERRAAAEREANRLSAVIRTYGLTAGAGRVVASALDDPEVVRAGSEQQLVEWLGLAEATGIPSIADFVLEQLPAARRDRLRKLAGYLAGFHWDLANWALNNIRGYRAATALRQIQILQSKGYWTAGGIPEHAAAGDREELVLAVAVQLRSPYNRDAADRNALGRLRAAGYRLVDSAPAGEAGGLRRLLAGGTRERGSRPELTPLETLLVRSDLRDYQRELVRTVLERVDPQLDTRRRDVYVEARRRLWYADRRQVIAHMGRGRGLDEAQIAKAVRTLRGFSREDQLKVTNWLLGDVFEDTKLWFVEGLGKGRIGGWADAEQALHESSVLPGTFKSAFGMARAPKIEQPKNLGEVEEILDYWDLAARALPEYQSYYRQLLARFDRSEDGSTGSELDPATFLERLSKLRAAVGDSRQGLLQFGSLADSEDASEAQLESALGRGQEGLVRARNGLARLAPDAQKLLAGIAGTRQETRTLLRSELEKGRPKKSWWQRCVANVTTAVGSFVEKLANPDNLMAALEVGLEIAGGLVTGGASILIRIAKWLVTSGMDLKKVVGEGLAKIKSYTSLEGLKKIIPIDRLFSTEGLVGSLVGAFFGQASTPGTGLAAKKPQAERKGPERRRKGSVVSRLLAMVDGVVSFLRSGYGQIQGFVAGQLAKIDLTQYPWFRKLIGFYARLMRLKAAAGGAVAQATGWVTKLRDQVAGFFDGVAGKVQAVLGLFANPAKEIASWVSNVVRTGVEYLLNLLVENPPSAILKTALKVLQGVTGSRLVDRFLKVPFAEEILGKVSSAVSGLIGGLLEAPAKEVYGWGKRLFEEQALPVIVGLRSSLESLLADGSGFLDRLTGGSWSSSKGTAGDRGKEGRIQRQPASPASPSHGPTPAAAFHPALQLAFRRAATAPIQKPGRAPWAEPTRMRAAAGRGELVQRTSYLGGVYEEFTKKLKGNLEKEALEYLLAEVRSGKPPVKVAFGGKGKKVGGRLAWVTEGEWSGSVVKRLLKEEWTTRSKDPKKKPPKGGKAYVDLVTRIHRAAKDVMTVTKVKCNVREIWILSPMDMSHVAVATERKQMGGRYFRHAQLVILTLPEEIGTGRLTGELLDEDTLFHELTHGCQHENLSHLKRRVREGIIEYFACQARGKEEPHAYENEVRCIRSLVRLRNCEKALRKACFKGEVDNLFNIDGWAKFYRLLGAGKYARAIEGLGAGSR